MQALQPLTPVRRPLRRSRVVSQSHSSQQVQNSRSSEVRKPLQTRKTPHRNLAIEATVKLSVNLVLSTVAVSALAHLFPYINMQQAKLEEVQTAVQSTHDRLQMTQLRFNRYFDPYQTKTLMQEHSNRIDPQQQQVVVIEAPTARPLAAAIQPPQRHEASPEAPQVRGY